MFADVVNAIKRAVKRQNTELTEAQRSNMRGVYERMDEAVRLFDKALERVAEKQGLQSSEQNGTIESETRFSKYWYPKLTRKEWNVLNEHMNREIENTAYSLDEATNWAFAQEKGVTVFALYGIGDGTDATPLYACGGMEAVEKYEELRTKLEAIRNETDQDGENVDTWIESFWSDRHDGSSNSNAAGRSRTKAGRTDAVHVRTPSTLSASTA